MKIIVLRFIYAIKPLFQTISRFMNAPNFYMRQNVALFLDK